MPLTPNDILKLSEPLEAMYMSVTDRVMVNIAKRFKTDLDLPAPLWQQRKLAEVEKLRNENAKIIQSETKQRDKVTNDTLLETAERATEPLEKEVAQAVKDGKTTGVDSTIATSVAIATLIAALSGQAKERFDLVNATTLNQSIQQYRNIIINTVQHEAKLAAQGKTILTGLAEDVESGRLTRLEALRKAINQFANNGITGFIDSAGRSWTPEAYVNMVMRTTVHNASIEAVQRRQEEYGSSIFQISAHSGARELCFPYQNWFCSWDNTSGVFTDGSGRQHSYVGINQTSYGEPAGIFGVNCRHYPQAVIPNVTIPHDMEEQNEAANKATYEESQKQRQLERSIRYAKRRADMANATGDKVAEDKSNSLVKQRQAAMRAFINETGRTRRYDREKV